MASLAPPAADPSRTHTRRFLTSILHTSSSSLSRASPSPSISSAIRAAAQQVDSSRISLDSARSSSSEEPAGSSDDVLSPTSPLSAISLESQINSIISILDDDSIPEDDKPDVLRDALMPLLTDSDSNGHSLDSTVLFLLHRYREDISPTGQTFSGPPTPSGKAALSRSSSFRRNTSSPFSQSPFGRRSQTGTPTRPLSPAVRDAFPTGSPISASRDHHLNVSASEFKPRSPVIKAPGSPAGTWSFQNSPLGTPKLSAVASGASSYFMPVPSKGDPIVPRGPWAENPDNRQSDEASSVNTSFTSQGSNDASATGESQTPPAFDQFQFQQKEAGLTGDGDYVITPFDMLCSVFAGSKVTSELIEQALDANNWEIDRAIKWIMDRSETPTKVPTVEADSPEDIDLNNLKLSPNDKSPRSNIPGPIFTPGGSRPRDTYSGSRSPSYTNKWSPMGHRAESPTPGSSGRVCRYYIQGNCLRSDCRFSHDISKAVCRFWMRGNCLKENCDFMHDVPSHLLQDIANMQASSMRSRDNDLMPRDHRSSPDHGGFTQADFDFPSLGSGSHHKTDKTRTRWASAAKRGAFAPRPDETKPQNDHQNFRPRPKYRHSVRVPLRPPTLVPTLEMGKKVAELYANYREIFASENAARSKCLTEAAQAYRQGDGHSARYWSKEAQKHNEAMKKAGFEAASEILIERKDAMRRAVLKYNHGCGISVGAEVGSNLGINLGVARENNVYEGTRLGPDEREEVAIDLHGLHSDEAVAFTTRFLRGLEQEGFKGLAFLIVGRERHSKAAGNSRLADGIEDFLYDRGYGFRVYGGIFAVDPLHHS